jgi:AcrR family transcriptional regulator
MSPQTSRRPRKSVRPPTVREPVQERSRDAWQRILDAGVDVLAEMGVRGFTVSKVCERAGVAVTAVYSRLDSRDQLLAAVYDHGMTTVRAGDNHFAKIIAGQPDAVAAAEVVQRSFRTHGAFIRATVLGSAESPYIAVHGAANVADLRAGFIDAAAGRRANQGEKALAAAYFAGIFSTLVLTVAFGEEFIHGDQEAEPVAALVSALAAALGQ